VTDAPIPLSTAIARGLRGRCPHCGEGRMFKSLLKVAHACPVCGEELNHHRADDLPAYLVVLLSGHIIVPLVVWVELAYSPSYWVHAAIWLPFTFIFCLGLLQPIKGAVVAVEWHKGLHGFRDAKQRGIAARSVGK
jgi:uncharacterized protein (DUF983 family)